MAVMIDINDGKLSMTAVAVLGRMLVFSRLKINTNDLDLIEQELQKNLKTVSGTVPVIIDSQINLDLLELVKRLWKLGIQPIGVVSGVLTEQADDLFLATFPPEGQRIDTLKVEKKPSEEPQEDTAKPQNVQERKSLFDRFKSKKADDDQGVEQDGSSVRVLNEETEGGASCICDGMLRSGQSFQHIGGDLAVLGGINRGAEAITDSNLHVYGRGLGRLVAGSTGDINARIFCQRFAPSLVAIAGTYCLHDDIPSEMIGKAVQVSCVIEDDKTRLLFKLMED